MEFNSLSFLLVFPLIVSVCVLLPLRFRHAWLLAVSFALYFSVSRALTLMLLLSVVSTYAAARMIQRLADESADACTPPEDGLSSLPFSSSISAC